MGGWSVFIAFLNDFDILLHKKHQNRRLYRNFPPQSGGDIHNFQSKNQFLEVLEVHYYRKSHYMRVLVAPKWKCGLCLFNGFPGM